MGRPNIIEGHAGILDESTTRIDGISKMRTRHLARNATLLQKIDTRKMQLLGDGRGAQRTSPSLSFHPKHAARFQLLTEMVPACSVYPAITRQMTPFVRPRMLLHRNYARQ